MAELNQGSSTNDSKQNSPQFIKDFPKYKSQSHKIQKVQSNVSLFKDIGNFQKQYTFESAPNLLKRVYNMYKIHIQFNNFIIETLEIELPKNFTIKNMIEEVYKHMALRGEKLSIEGTEAYISKKSGLAKEDLPSYRKDLCLCETDQSEFTLKFEQYLDSHQEKCKSLNNLTEKKSSSSSVATLSPYQNNLNSSKSTPTQEQKKKSFWSMFKICS